MLDKIYKMSIIIIATFLVGFSLYLIISPTKAVSQLKPTNNYAIPESHEWEAISSINADGGWHRFMLYNKKTGVSQIFNAR